MHAISPTTLRFATAWIAPPVPSPVANLLADLGRAFDARGFRWYLFGAQAAIVYGVARLTADVDVTVQSSGIPTVEWMGDLERCGFEGRFADPVFVEQTRVLPVLHAATGLPVDIVIAGPGLEDEFLQRAVVRTVDGVPVPVVDLTDLVILKVLAGRPKDVEDIVMLMRLHVDGIDAERLHSVLRAIEQALGQSDLLPLLERCRSRAGI